MTRGPRKLRFSVEDYDRLRERIRDMRRGTKFVPVSREDMSNLLIDISRLGGLGEGVFSDDEVVEAYRMIDTDRGNSRNVREQLLCLLLQRWKTLTATA